MNIIKYNFYNFRLFFGILFLFIVFIYNNLFDFIHYCNKMFKNKILLFYILINKYVYDILY